MYNSYIPNHPYSKEIYESIFIYFIRYDFHRYYKNYESGGIFIYELVTYF